MLAPGLSAANLVLRKFFHTHKTPLNPKDEVGLLNIKIHLDLGVIQNLMHLMFTSISKNRTSKRYTSQYQFLHSPVFLPSFFPVFVCIPTRSAFILKTLWLYHLRAVDGFLCWIRIGIFSFISIHMYFSF